MRGTTRRMLVVVALTAGAVTSTAWQAGAGAGAGQVGVEWAKVAIGLPAPTGPHPVGHATAHLVDRSRPDPWVADRPYREVMVSLWYPARRAEHRPRAPYRTAAEAAHADRRLPEIGLPSGALDWTGPTHAREGAPVDRRGGRYPVVLYSSGHLASRTLGTGVAEDLASRGYVVVAVDHTHEAAEVEFPGGRVEVGSVPVPTGLDDPWFVEFHRRTMDARVKDLRFVLDRLATLPAVSGALDLTRVGMFGVSAGGATAIELMYHDRRVRAGADLDSGLSYDPYGEVLPPVAVEGLDRPVLLMGSEQSGLSHRTDPSLASFWRNQRGWKLDLLLRGSNHPSFSDRQVFVPRLGAAGLLTPEQVSRHVGTIDPARSVEAQRTYLAAFFDRFLRGRAEHLLDGPSPRYPEVEFRR
ncbi:hypothetical protein ABZ816_02280 [Actinosynnema sp. NPDC047251]|uniref:Lipase n=1 Tax=Saccharothrix espanaensis (strain ATCC 51144 / DSM 44229 / JCM 9112 / NBRC 15066 / NRRL 15764) TaxID=1179773 RepID=K0K2K3_SACES|nr:hypothetical protein [Saccharothrix espanaensis]CCH31079.1 hypothetical protein BN6_37880 [Saccharothrix espanaensis DSM 44229]